MRLRNRASYFLDKFSGFYNQLEYAFSTSLSGLDHEKRTAVVIHLYYPELWPKFESRIKQLPQSYFNLFVSIPKEKISFAATIIRTFPESKVIPVPNRGRDVLPFLMFMRELRKYNYEWILKLHSKKSPQIKGGEVWLNNVLDCLLPTDDVQLCNLKSLLESNDVGMIGPEGYFFNGENLMKNNLHWLGYCDRCLFEHSGKLIHNISNFGFFAGTMFWVKPSACDLLRPLQRALLFDAERGQTDSTLAHAIERILPYIVSYSGKKVMQSGQLGVSTAKPAACNIETWQGEPLRSE